MNIFATSPSPRMCALHLDDKRLNKMMLETTQIICTVVNCKEGSKVTPYKSCHVNHPATLWARESHRNLNWLVQLAEAYENEIRFRFGRTPACVSILERVMDEYPDHFIHVGLKPRRFYNGARHGSRDIDFTFLPVHVAYKQYLKARWPDDKIAPKWTRRKPPSWK
jgi:hypothetical protein